MLSTLPTLPTYEQLGEGRRTAVVFKAKNNNMQPSRRPACTAETTAARNNNKKSQNKRHLTTQILCIAKTGQLVHELEILRKRSSLFNLGVSVSEQAEDSVSQGSGEGIEMQTTSKATKAPSEPFDDSWLPPPPEKTSSWKLASNAVRAPIRMKRSSEANAKWKAEGLKAASKLLVDLDDMIATAENGSQQGSQVVRAGKAPLEPSHLAADQTEPPDGCAASSADKEMLQLPLVSEAPPDAGRAPAELKQATNRRRQFSVEHTEEGDAYFVDNATLETTWDVPADAFVVGIGMDNGHLQDGGIIPSAGIPQADDLPMFPLDDEAPGQAERALGNWQGLQRTSLHQIKSARFGPKR